MQKWIFPVFSLLLGISFSCAADEWRTVTVENTFDGRPFTYLEKPLAVRPGYAILRLKYPSPLTTAIEQNNTVPADFYLPDGIKPGDPRRPAVICLHILDGNDALTDMLCSSLAARGIPAFAFKLPYYGERGLPEGPMAMAKDPKLFAGAIEQTSFDVRRTVDLLASRPEIDPQKIGIAGISLGGIIAASAAGGEPRLNRAALLLAGGDVVEIIHTSHETRPLSETIKAMTPDEQAALEEKIKALDPLHFAPGLRDRAQNGKVLMINATDDEVIPKKCTEKLADALAIPDKIVWLDGLGHYTAMAELPFSLKTAADFFALDLPPGVVPPSVESRKTEMKKFADVLRQTATLLAEKPASGKFHEVKLGFTSRIGDQSFEGRVQIRRTSDKRFTIAYKLPLLGEMSLGQGDYPWIVSNGTVLAGTENGEGTAKDLQDFIASWQLVRVRSLAGLLKAASATPEVLLRFMDIAVISRNDGRSGIVLAGKPPIAAMVKMFFERDERTLSEMNIEAESFQATLRFLNFRIDAPIQPEDFDPPAGLPVKKVERKEVYQKFEALSAFAESVGRM